MRRLVIPVALSAAVLLATCLSLLGRHATAEAAPIRYAAIGASDTIGVGAPDPSIQGWVPVFASMLGPDTEVTNLGVSGTLIHQALSDQLPGAVAADPDVVTVWLAVNDFNARVPLDAYAADLDTLLGALRDQTHAQVLVGNIPDLSVVPVYADVDPNFLRAEVDRWNAAIAAAAARDGATLVDLHTSWQELADHPEYVGTDGFHPSAAGHERLAELFYAAFQS